MKVICLKSFIDRDIIIFEKGVTYDIQKDGWVRGTDNIAIFVPSDDYFVSSNSKNGEINYKEWTGSYKYFRLLRDENLEKLGI